MFGDGFEQSTILRTGPDGLTRVITRSSWDRRESVLVEAYEAELVVLRRWEEFHREALGFTPSGRRMPAEANWLRIWFRKDQVASGGVARLYARLTLIAERGVNLSTVAVFEKEGDNLDKYLYFSPGAASAFREVAVEHGAQRCERPAVAGLFVFYGNVALAWKLFGLAAWVPPRPRSSNYSRRHRGGDPPRFACRAPRRR
jgi:hypothetical protein